MRSVRRAALPVVVTLVALAPRAMHAQEPVRDTSRVSRDTLPGRDSLARRDSAVVRDTLAARDTVLRVCTGGDVTLGSNLDPWLTRYLADSLRRGYGLRDDPDTLLAPLRPLLEGADVVLLNVEGAIGVGPAPLKCPRGSRNCYAFRQPLSTARALKAIAPRDAVVVGNVANNHSRDAGVEGFAATMRHLGDAGVLVTGADTLATPVPTARGDTIAMLGFYTASDVPDARDLPAVHRHVQRAVERWGTVIVTAHIGAEGVRAQRTRNETELFLRSRINRGNPVAFANAALAAGATAVIGHGPHVLRAGEWRRDRLVLYSLGNLLTYGPFRNDEPVNRGAIACFGIAGPRRISDAELRPTVQLSPGVVMRDDRGRALHLVDSLSRLDFPRTGVRVTRDGRLLKPGELPGDSVRAVRKVEGRGPR